MKRNPRKHFYGGGARRPCVLNERGFALPMTIFLVTMITIMLTSAFTRTASEQSVSTGSTAVVKALSVAQSGLQSFVGESLSVRPAPGDSIRYNVVDGYAWVAPQLMHVPSDTMLGFTYIVRSTGYYIEPNLGSTEQGKREVAQFMRWEHGVRQIGAWVSANATDFWGYGVEFFVNGNDACGALPATTGIYQRAANPSIFPADSVTGSPAEIRAGSGTDVAQQVGINWQAIENGDWSPDWTTLAGADGDTTFGTYLLDVTQETIGPGFEGTGLLVITGGIESHGFEWNGVVIAGKDFDAWAGNTVIRGMLITGLDVLVGDATLTTQFEDNTSLRVEYNSCYVERAMKTIRGMVAVQNAWVDNWAMY